jgi:acylphosphatase
MKQKSMHLVISGDVQGLGYRAWMRREAQRIGIVGWVKNRQDGGVEAVIQGEEEDVKKLIEKAKLGPDVAWVERVDANEQSVDGNLLTFEVVY